jgi:hypothetical protein
MSFQRTVGEFEPLSLQAGVLASHLASIVQAACDPPFEVRIEIKHELADGTYHYVSSTALSDLASVCLLGSGGPSIDVFVRKDRERPLAFHLLSYKKYFRVQVSSDSAEVLNRVVARFNELLSPAPHQSALAQSQLLLATLSPRRETEGPSSQPPQARRHASAAGSELAVPEKVTLTWLAKHVPVGLWASAVGIVLAAFAIGVKIGSVDSVRDALAPVLGIDARKNESTPPTK